MDVYLYAAMTCDVDFSWLARRYRIACRSCGPYSIFFSHTFSIQFRILRNGLMHLLRIAGICLLPRKNSYWLFDVYIMWVLLLVYVNLAFSRLLFLSKISSSFRLYGHSYWGGKKMRLRNSFLENPKLYWNATCHHGRKCIIDKLQMSAESG